MKSLAALLPLVLLLGGCVKNDTRPDLQQEKLVLELMQAQRAQLATLMQEERNLQALKKENEEALASVAKQRAALDKDSRESSQRNKSAEDALAKEKAALKDQGDRVEAARKAMQLREAKHRQTEQEHAAAKAELARLRLALEAERKAANAKVETAQQVRKDQIQAGIDARVKKRQPSLEALATLTASLFTSPAERDAARTELLDLLSRSHVAEIQDDDIFVVRARGLAESYYLDKIKYPYLAHERKVFDSWGQQYLKGEPLTMK